MKLTLIDYWKKLWPVSSNITRWFKYNFYFYGQNRLFIQSLFSTTFIILLISQGFRIEILHVFLLICYHYFLSLRNFKFSHMFYLTWFCFDLSLSHFSSVHYIYIYCMHVKMFYQQLHKWLFWVTSTFFSNRQKRIKNSPKFLNITAPFNSTVEHLGYFEYLSHFVTTSWNNLVSYDSDIFQTNQTIFYHKFLRMKRINPPVLFWMMLHHRKWRK